MFEFFHNIKDLWLEACRLVKAYPAAWAAFWAAVVGLTAAVWPFDRVWLEQVQVMAGEETLGYIRWISESGDFHYAPTIVFFFVLVLGILRKSKALRISAVALLMGAGAAGIGVNLLKPMFGRPRPYTQIEDGFYPLKVSHEHGSLPSGHASSTLGLTVATVVLFPPSAAIAIPYSIEVCRSRMVLDRHYPSDIVAGVGLGSFCGLLFGFAGRRLRNQQREEESGGVGL